MSLPQIVMLGSWPETQLGRLRWGGGALSAIGIRLRWAGQALQKPWRTRLWVTLRAALRKWGFPAGLLGATLLMLVNCGSAAGNSLPAEVLYQDDFSADAGNWALDSDLEASATYADGKLHQYIASPNLIAWAELKDREFDDFSLEVDATQISGPDDNSYGVVFRLNSPSAYYRFDISGDGHLSFMRRDESDGGRWVEVIDWTPSAAIHRGASSNRIKVVAQGSHFSFSVNGQLVAEADDGTYRSGAIGLEAGSFDEPGVRIAFDNLIVRQP